MFKKGDIFTHPTKFDLNWTNGPGQTWTKDAPKARCVVTSVRGDSVYYRYADADPKQGAAFVTTQQALANLMEAYK